MIFKQLNDDVCKTYLIADENSRTAVLIDPIIIYTENYLDMLQQEDFELTHVIDTHTHADHISAGPSLAEATGCEYVMFRKSPVKCVTKRVKDGDTLKAAGTEFKFMHTPGHTKDSLSIISGDKFFTGDFLFLDDGGAGRDDLPGGNPGQHWDSFRKLEELSDDLMVYPAHDYRERQPSELGKQKKENPHLKERTRKEFVAYINDLKLGPADWMHDVLKANVSCTKDPDAAYIPKDAPACEVMGTADPGLESVEVGYIDVQSFREIVDSDINPVLLDVREPEELTDTLGHIDGIINIPVGLLSAYMGKLDGYKDSPLIVICRSGGRAGTAGKMLVNSGFNDVRVLEGGMIAYRSAGY